MQACHTFLLPAGHRSPTGGNIYNSRLISALRRMGVRVETRSIYSDIPKKNDNRIFWIDSLCMAEGMRCINALKNKSPAFIMAHLLQCVENSPEIQREPQRLQQEYYWLPRVSGFLATSSFTRRLLQSKKASQTVFLVPPALSLRPEAREIRKQDLSEFRGLMVGHVSPRKGFLPFLQFLRRLLTKTSGFSLRIAGRKDIDRDYSRDVHRMIASSSCLTRNVSLLGPLSQEKLQQEYRQANIFISASFWETYGMALAEARAFGLPVLALDRGNVAFHVDAGQSGFLFAGIPELSQACLQLIQSPKRLIPLHRNMPPAKNPSYTWNHAARSLINQFNSWKRLKRNA
jgi:glycosyltransferase involved in cell wall biosynthesis